MSRTDATNLTDSEWIDARAWDEEMDGMREQWMREQTLKVAERWMRMRTWMAEGEKED